MLYALTLWQPYAWAIFNAGKDIENRDWPTKFRGTIAIHTAKKEPANEYDMVRCLIERDIHGYGKSPWGELPDSKSLERGSIVGLVDIVDCVDESDSYWFTGDCGFVLANPMVLKAPIPCRSYQMFWKVLVEIETQINKQLYAK